MTTAPTKSLTAIEAGELLLQSDDFLILTHANPDGDTCGSAAGLCAALRVLGKRSYILPNSTITPMYLPFISDYLSDGEFNPRCVISVDIADTQLFPAGAEDYIPCVDLCIDHHSSNKFYAKNTLLNEHAAACGEIILDLIGRMGVVLTREIALPLYVAISTDTGCFRFSNTTAGSLRAAADLLETGIDYVDINTRFFETKTKARLRIEQKISEELRFFDNDSIVFGAITRQMIADTGAKEDDVDNISSMLRCIEGIDIGVLLRERGDNLWKISVRTSTAANASHICASFGGGGHARAAGCILHGSRDEAVALFLRAIETEKATYA